MSEELWFGSRHWQHIFLLFSKASKTGSEARPATYAVGIGDAFPVGKATWTIAEVEKFYLYFTL